jgi:hypothetical protein
MTPTRNKKGFVLRLCIYMLLFGMCALPLFDAHAQARWGDFESGLFGGSIDDFIGRPNPLTQFMGRIINIVTGLVIVIGVISIVIGGYLYITAGGSADRTKQAKVWIGSALLAIVLALAAWVILNTLSPQFVPQADPVLEIHDD